MEVGNTINDFEYTFDIEKLVGNEDDDTLIIAGAISDSTIDLDGERVDQTSLFKAWKQYLKNPVIRLMHKSEIGAIGRVIPDFTDSKGKVHKTGLVNGVPHIVAMISKAPDLKSIRIKIREGVYSGLSIGGKARSVKKNGIVTLMIKSLLEVSVVDIPSNKNSLFAVIKSACTGDNCPINKEHIINVEESKIMEAEITELIEKKFSDMKQKDDYATLEASFKAAQSEIADLKKSAMVGAGEKVEEVEKSPAEQIAELKAELEAIKTKPVEKGVQDGEVIEKAAPEPGTIAEQMIVKYYGGK